MVRYIVSGFPRCGSTLLLAGLQQHPNIKIFNEPFHEYLEGRYEVNGRKYQDDEDGESFVRFIYESPYEEQYTAIGFKLFGQQARSRRAARSAWDYFRREKDIKVVYIDRENWLELVVSMEVAAKTKVWAIWNTEKHEAARQMKKQAVGPIEIDPKICEFWFRIIDRARQSTFADSIGHPVLRVYYSELAGNFLETIHSIHDFLEVPRHDPEVQTVKQATKPLRERVANYEQLEEYFRDSPYRRFFESEYVAPAPAAARGSEEAPADLVDAGEGADETAPFAEESLAGAAG